MFEDSEHYNGIELSMEIEKDDEYVDDDDYDNQTLYVRATSGGKELGHVLFSFDGEYLLPQDLEVEERYRGRGIAQTMYDFVKSKGYKIRRSGQQTDAGAGFWAKHRPEQNVWENFADGQHPEDKGDSKRYHVPTKSSVSNLRKFAKNHSGRAAQLAHWAANMKAGRAKKKTNETTIGHLQFPRLTIAIDDHAVDRTRTRGISPAAIDQSLKKLSSIADQLAQMEVNNTVWVYDVANNLGMGLRRISSQNMLFKLKTVVGARPYDGAIPIIELS